ncbi:MAG: outer membrane lipoprotein carrier protein LolA [Desulfovibrio sp.]|jgi:outer membrane lipoprotein carrier protein|nr:outer membrane lipoprotein carrier protein LolA [Desulfovibrio sp.]
MTTARYPFDPRTLLFRACLAGVALLLTASLSRAITPPDLEALDGLRQKAASAQSVQSDFVQETAIPMFAQPISSKGRFVFKRPDGLLWEYTEPMREGFAMRGESGARWAGDKGVRTPFTTASDPLAAIIGRQLVAWIIFDTASIERDFRIAVTGKNPLELTMTPARDDMREIIEAIVIVFTEQGPASRVAVRETRGGTTTISFSNTVVNAPVDDAEFK